jgi:hypothetical protein
MAVLDSQIHKSGGRVGGGQRGRKLERWPDRIDQQYVARLIEEGRLTRGVISLVDWLTDVRCATAEQISRIFFSNEGTAKNRLTTLYKLRLLERTYMAPNDAIELDYSPYVLAYYVGRGGRYWLSQAEKRRFESGWKVLLPQQVAHDLMSTELMAALHEEFRRLNEATGSKVRMRLESEVIFWKLDAVGQPVWKEGKGRDGKTVRERGPLLRSDMRFEAKEGEDDNGPTLLSAFIEADRGTMTNPQFAEKVGAYNLAAQQWSTRETVREAKGEGAARPFPQVLVVTTGPTRVRNLLKTISEKAAEGVIWAVIDWAGLRGTDKVLTAPVWGKATQGKTAAERALLPGLAGRLGFVGGGATDGQG